MLINYTNHPSALWSKKQTEISTRQYGKIIDVAFRSVAPSWDEEKVYQVACEEYKRILDTIKTTEKQEKEESNKAQQQTAVLCQGEATLSFLLVKFLMQNNIKVISAVSERITKEEVENGICKKTLLFEFQGYREYDGRNFRDS